MNHFMSPEQRPSKLKYFYVFGMKSTAL